MSHNFNHAIGILARSTNGTQRLSSSSSSSSSSCIRSIHLTPIVRLQKTVQKSDSGRVIRDENIRARRVRLVDPQTNELMPGPFNTAELLASIDRTRFTLQQVSPGKFIEPTPKPSIAKEEGEEEKSGQPARGWKSHKRSANPKEDEVSTRKPDPVREEPQRVMTLDDLPIVKLIDKKVEYEKIRLARKQKQGETGEESSSGGTSVKSATTLHKNVVLSWQSTTHDIQHKLQPIRANMIKRGGGASCTITIASKKGKGSAIDEEGKLAFLNELEKYLCDWSNAANVLAEESAQPSEAKKLSYFPRRRGDVVWQKNNRTAILIVEVARR